MPGDLTTGRRDSEDKGHWVQLLSPVFCHLVQHREKSGKCYNLPHVHWCTHHPTSS